MTQNKKRMAIQVNLTSDMFTRVHKWTPNVVSEFLHQNSMGRYANLLCQKNEVDGEILLLLRDVDLRLPPISIPVLAHIKRITILVDYLRKREREWDRIDGTVGRFGNGAPKQLDDDDPDEDYVTDGQINSQELGHISQQLNAFSFSDNEEDESCCPTKLRSASAPKPRKPKFEPEIFKTFVSFVYAMFVALLTAFTMTVAHDRVPDMDKYPPLPDIFLDNVPRIEWAFEACEACAIMLSTILLVVLILHKHRSIILRRFFALTGTCFLLRCITMFATSLSVPGLHLQCSGKVYGSSWTKMGRALEIMCGLGMSVTGVHTCGDYMFSGHTICLTMFNFFITEYTPRNMTLLHTSSWVLNIFGSFFVLAAHEHYSIDVVIAFYISSRLFLYYHTLANTLGLGPAHQRDKRTSVWFPMFSYLEARVTNVVPNEYEWPAIGVPGFMTPWRRKSGKCASD